MKKLAIIILVLIVVGVGFYWGYHNAISPNKQSGSTNQKTIIMLDPTTIPANAITQETTLVVTLDTPVTLQDADGRNGTLKLVVSPNANTANKKGFLIDMELTSAPSNIQVVRVSPKIAVLDNASFTIALGGNPSGSVDKGLNINIKGNINSINDNQVNIYLKLSSW